MDVSLRTGEMLEIAVRAEHPRGPRVQQRIRSKCYLDLD